MRRSLIVIAAFITSAILGTVLLLLVSMAVGYVQIAIDRHNHPGSGIGAVVGSISETIVFAIPILCGIIGTLITLHRIERRSSKPPTSSLP
jgi:hypothetical protein